MMIPAKRLAQKKDPLSKEEAQAHPAKAMAVFLSSVIAALAGTGGVLVSAFNDDDDDGDRSRGSAVSAWRATDETFYVPSAAQRVLSLDDGWRFHTGDDTRWSAAAWDDSSWSEIAVDSRWESEGYADYDGFAWYRGHFTAPATLPEGSFYLRLGRIDDADEVWLNGEYLGRHGELKAGGQSAYDVHRRYAVPRQLVRAGAKNLIAVRVWDERLGGGMMAGDPALMVQALPAPLVDLTGEWQLSVDDQPDYCRVEVDTAEFSPVVVPGNWDLQGKEGFDGHLWYRVAFTAPEGLAADDSLVLVLGAVDDEDETYLNGELIGETHATSAEDRVWERPRVYTFPAGSLRAGEKANVVAVRVYDERSWGGIRHGPVGIMTASDWETFQAGREVASHSWLRVWNWLLGRS
ncbi:beta galactosidase jelly roll domain-containing protein [Actomonas aquatica]|uniref:Beta galactosidase jelly roll domain-containing protein n=1 Tax=Actomonas aquatica TaxID=2866162 RepID=A0ABZ1C7Z5_9BACT|nr:beta galactosidase jelly roll domain-containing protein [Opitutus sp. WL0086]WRQ87709.1 beta galactosidase jelly roll domain-containing protein [Opitutus sp. WL0086]